MTDYLKFQGSSDCDTTAKPQNVGKWLLVHKGKPVKGRKTDRYFVFGDGGSYLGMISWYAPWRRFAFTVLRTHVVFESECLNEISLLLNRLTGFRRTARKTERLVEYATKRLGERSK